MDKRNNITVQTDNSIRAGDYDPDCCIDKVGATVRRLVRIFQMFERDEIKIYGFTTSQCYTLLEIDKAESISMNELSAKMNLDSSTMTRIIGNLVRDGLVDRKRDPEDRRVVTVCLEEKGKETAKKLNESIKDYYRRTLEYLPEGRVEEVLIAVSVLITAFEKANPNCC